MPNECLHLHEVDETSERLCAFGSTRTDGKVNHCNSCFEAIFYHRYGAIEVGTDAVHLVHEAHTRNVVLVGLTPHGFGLRFNTSNRVEHSDSTVEYAQ